MYISTETDYDQSFAIKFFQEYSRHLLLYPPTLRSLLEEQSILSKQGEILMKNNQANRAILKELGKHFQRHIMENRAK